MPRWELEDQDPESVPNMTDMIADRIMNEVVEPLLEMIETIADVDDERREAIRQQIVDCVNGEVFKRWS